MRISDWSSDVCSSDLAVEKSAAEPRLGPRIRTPLLDIEADRLGLHPRRQRIADRDAVKAVVTADRKAHVAAIGDDRRSRARRPGAASGIGQLDRNSVVSGKSWSVRVDLGGRRSVKKT